MTYVLGELQGGVVMTIGVGESNTALKLLPFVSPTLRALTIESGYDKRTLLQGRKHMVELPTQTMN